MTTVERFEIPVSEDEAEWLEARRPYWNASYAGTLFGVHPYVTLADACVEKITGHRQSVTSSMLRGTAMEPYISDVAAKKLGLDLQPSPVMFGRGVLLSTMDRVVPDDPDVSVEIKSTTDRVGDDPPRHWYWQTQAQMWCYGSEHTIIAYLDPGLEVEFFDVPRNDRDIALLVERASEVMASVSLGELPEGLDLTADNIDMLYPEDDGSIAAAPLDYARFVLDYDRASAAIAAWKKVKDEARNKIVETIGPASTLTIDGIPAATYKATKGGERFDFEAFAFDHPLLVEEYTRFRPGGRRIYVPKKAAPALLARLMETNQEEEL